MGTFFLLFLLPFAAIISFLIYFPFMSNYLKKHGKRPVYRHLAIYMFIGVIFCVIYVTIFYSLFGRDTVLFVSNEHRLLNLTPFAWVNQTYEMGARRMVLQLLGNIAMIIPVGFITPVVFKSMRVFSSCIAAVVGGIILIECIQYFIGRSADMDDLIMNTLGAIIGFMIFVICNTLFKENRVWGEATDTEKISNN